MNTTNLSRYFFGIKTILILSSLGSTQAEVLWYGNPDKPLKEVFQLLNRETGEEGTAVREIDPEYGKAWVINKPAGSKRTELSRTLGYTPKEGDKVYVGWDEKIDIAGSDNPNEGFAIFQLKTTGDGFQNYPVFIDYDGSKIKIIGVDSGEGKVSLRDKVFTDRSLKESTWINIVLGIYFSSNEKLGYVEVWLNGEKQNLLNQNNQKQSHHKTLDEGEMYFKWGAYNEAGRDFEVTVQLANMRVATTLESLQGPIVKLGAKRMNSQSPSNLHTLPQGFEIASHSYPATISIRDTQGKTVWIKENVSKDLFFAKNEFKPGLYFLRIENNLGSEQFKFILSP